MFLVIYTLIVCFLFAQLTLAQPFLDIMDSSMRAATHNTSSAGFHMADFSSFLSHLSDAVSAAWPSGFPTRYRRVKVLLMSWDKDDLDLHDQIRSLESVFRGLYHYDTEYWKIPSRRSAVELSRKVANLVDAHGQEGNLLVLYYGGHARPNEQAGGSPVWAAKLVQFVIRISTIETNQGIAGVGTPPPCSHPYCTPFLEKLTAMFCCFMTAVTPGSLQIRLPETG